MKLNVRKKYQKISKILLKCQKNDIRSSHLNVVRYLTKFMSRYNSLRFSTPRIRLTIALKL